MNPLSNLMLFPFLLYATATATTNIALNKPANAESHYLDNTAAKAVDGDTATMWNSGIHHPAWLEVDLTGSSTMDSICVKLAQTPAGLTGFQVWAYSGPDSIIAARWAGVTENGSWLRRGFAEPLRNIDRIRIFSEHSPSWIAFYEVEVFGVITGKKRKPEGIHSITPPDTRSYADSNEYFAIDIYKKLAADNGNIIFSPYSISSALAMTWGGARSITKREMAKVLHFSDSISVHASFDKTRRTLDSQNDGVSQLLIANSIWPQKNEPFLPDFVALLKTYYGVAVEYQDYMNETESARRTINAWVGDKTRGNIIDLLPQGALDASTMLVITNAIYFKAAWIVPFDRNSTGEGDFTLHSGTVVSTRYMRNVSGFRYAETDEVKALEMPYSGRQLSMIVLLPKTNNLSAVESALSLAELHRIIKSLRRWKVSVALPKFKMEHSFELSKTLSSMGMQSAFISGKADFSGMDGTKRLFISDVIHKACIDVTEEGTVAAAATASRMVYISQRVEPEPKELFADHPFMYLIRDDKTGTILFIGRLTDPLD